MLAAQVDDISARRRCSSRAWPFTCWWWLCSDGRKRRAGGPAQSQVATLEDRVRTLEAEAEECRRERTRLLQRLEAIEAAREFRSVAASAPSDARVEAASNGIQPAESRVHGPDAVVGPPAEREPEQKLNEPGHWLGFASAGGRGAASARAHQPSMKLNQAIGPGSAMNGAASARLVSSSSCSSSTGRCASLTLTA